MYILRAHAAGILYAPPFYTPPSPRRVVSGVGGVGVYKIGPVGRLQKLPIVSKKAASIREKRSQSTCETVLGDCPGISARPMCCLLVSRRVDILWGKGKHRSKNSRNPGINPDNPVKKHYMRLLVYSLFFPESDLCVLSATFTVQGLVAKSRRKWPMIQLNLSQ